MRKAKVKTIRALSRGLDVLRLVESSGGVSLSDIHRHTKLAKATILRILATLQDEGLVWQRIVDNAYLAAHVLVENVRAVDEETHLVEVASPLLEQLSRVAKWPSVLAVPRLGHMEVIEANTPRAYFNDIALDPVGFQINMLLSATGRAYLAFCSDSEREAILARLAHSQRAGDRMAKDTKWVREFVRHVKKQGYALRDPRFGGKFDVARSEFDDGRDSIAVPIFSQDRVLGCLNLTWSRHVHSSAEIVNLHLAQLKEVAAKIGAALERR